MRLYALLVVLLFAIGCAKAPAPAPVMLHTGNTGTVQYQIDTKPVEPDTVTPIAGSDTDTIVTIVTIPASSVPTTVTIIEKPKTLRQKILPKKKEPEHKVDVISTNPNVTATFPEHTPWWEYIAWFVAIITPILTVIVMFGEKLSWLAEPYRWLKKIWLLFRRKKK